MQHTHSWQKQLSTCNYWMTVLAELDMQRRASNYTSGNASTLISLRPPTFPPTQLTCCMCRMDPIWRRGISEGPPCGIACIGVNIAPRLTPLVTDSLPIS
jgi:hypothetical protein